MRREGGRRAVCSGRVLWRVVVVVRRWLVLHWPCCVVVLLLQAWLQCWQMGCRRVLVVRVGSVGRWRRGLDRGHVWRACRGVLVSWGMSGLVRRRPRGCEGRGGGWVAVGVGASTLPNGQLLVMEPVVLLLEQLLEHRHHLRSALQCLRCWVAGHVVGRRAVKGAMDTCGEDV